MLFLSTPSSQRAFACSSHALICHFGSSKLAWYNHCLGLGLGLDPRRKPHKIKLLYFFSFNLIPLASFFLL